jgi:AcrR family transcriptional regulator
VLISADKPLRRDAAENRERLLTAAGQVFESQGLDASVEEVAKAAGVGMGTLYRRFPTKEALIEALVQEMLTAITGMAESAADEPNGTGLEVFLAASGDYQATHPGCLSRLWASADQESVRGIRAKIAELLVDAQRHSRLRSDLTPSDITMILWSIRGVIETSRSVAPDAWRRYLEVILGGLRSDPQAGRALTQPPLSQDQVDRILLR